MGRDVYFDVLDPVRTAAVATPEDRQRSAECLRIAQAELMMSVLRGWTPVLPQTYGWDSTALLSCLDEDGKERASFKWLLRKGLIKIRLREHRSIWDAALDAFQRPEFHRLSAWPEFDTDDPLEARRPLVEAMRTGKSPAALPESARRRLDQLRELSDAAAQAPPSGNELPRGDRLRALIERTANAAQEVDPRIADLLRQCIQISGSNIRTALFDFLDSREGQLEFGVPEARDVVNCCYNSVAAECVQADCSGLTTPQSHNEISVKLLLRALPGSHRADVFEGHGPHLSSGDLSNLERVSWTTVHDFLKGQEDVPLTERDRQAEAARLITKVVVEGNPRYAFTPKIVNFLTNAALWGGAAVNISPMLTIIAAGLAGGLGTLNFGAAVQASLVKRVSRKWEGVLQAAQRPM